MGTIAAVVLLTLTTSGLAESAKMVVFNNRYVKKSGDTMTGALIIDRDGRDALYLDGTQVIAIDWDSIGPAVAGLEFTQTGTQSGNEWFIKLPTVGAGDSGIDSAFNWKVMEMWPIADNVYNCGGSNRWKNFYSYKGDFADTVLIDKDTVGNLLSLRPDWSLGTVVCIDMVNAGGTYDLNDFYFRVNDVLGGGEYDGLRSDGTWKGAFFQAGNGELLIADGESKCAMYPGGIYAEPNFDAPYPFWAGTFIDASNYTVTGPVGAGNIFFNVGDGGGALPDDISLSFLGVMTMNIIEPVGNDWGHVGSRSGKSFQEMSTYDMEIKETATLPPDMDTYGGVNSSLELDATQVPSPWAETLTIGNAVDGGFMSIDGWGQVKIQTAPISNYEALDISRDGTNYTTFMQDGSRYSTASNVSELVHITGFTVFPAFEQSNGGDSVGYYGVASHPTVMGNDTYINFVYVDLQTETTAAYISNIAIYERTAGSMTLSQLASVDVTWGQGNTNYLNEGVAISPAVSPVRLAIVRVTCDNSPADWVRVSRVATRWNSPKP